MQDVARRILIVNDSESDRLAIRSLLQQKPSSRYVFEEVGRGELEFALSACERFRPDCVILDSSRPDMQGLELLSAIRKQFSLSFAIVLLIGSASETFAIQTLNEGAQDHLPKDSLTSQTLEHAIWNALDKINLENRRLAAEQALAENERKLRDVINAAPCALYTVDLVAGRSLYISGFSEGLIGYSPSEIHEIGPSGMLLLIHPEDRPLIESHLQKLRQADDSDILECQFRIKHKNGTWRWLSVRDRVVARDHSGSITMLAGAATDISHRKDIEDELLESQTQLMVAQEAAGIGAWAWDLQGHTLACSPLCMKLYGRPEDEPEFSKVWDEWIHPDDRPRVSDDLSKAFAGTPLETEFRTLWSDQSVRWLRSQGKLVTDSVHGARFLGATLDITEKKKNENELKRSNDELERFAYVASHDLQEPLRTILSFSELFARRNKSVDAESKQYLDYIRQGGHRMQALISDLLTFSRVTQASEEPLTLIDCNEVLAEALSGLHKSIEETSAEIAAGDLPHLTGNFQQMAQLFQNLVGNAIKYRAGNRPVIRVSASRTSRGWQFCVSDNGIGFDMAYSDKIFEAFKRLHSRDQYSGTGIGLAICQRIVERHGGRIWAESNPGDGSKFYFTINDATVA